MPEITLRPITGEERLAIWRLHGGYAFRPTPPLPDAAAFGHILDTLDDALHVALFEDGHALASCANSPMTQNVRGALYPMGGVWGVATMPEGRRKGYARQMLGYLLAEARKLGQAFSMLYPFRESFYERLGYITFPLGRLIQFETTALAPLLKRELRGTVRLYHTPEEGIPAFREYLHQVQPGVHGMAVVGDKALNSRFFGGDYWIALAQVDARTIGSMLYRIDPGERVITLRDFLYSDYDGLMLLLEWLARHIDHAHRIRMTIPAFAQPETWITDLHPQVEAQQTPLGRIIDVGRIGGMQVGEGTFTAQIVDDLCPWNTGIYCFASVEGILEVSPASSAECSLTIQALSALVYGTVDPGLFVHHGWGDPSPAQQQTLRRLFPPMLPHLNEKF
ncbi:MAG: GNAT family N-acetyltransferase [Anaerolineae bacterium]